MKIANFKLQIAKVNFFHFSFFILPFALLVISGCVGFQTAGEIQTGRYELLLDKAESALLHFQRAAQMDPNYIMNFSLLQQSVWTYVGKAYYQTGKLADARKALERARSHYDSDQMARLYLGLTLARDGDQQRGLKEIESGIKGFRDWLNYVDQYLPDGKYWDPGGILRSEIRKQLAVISGRDINWPKLISSSEWLGKKMEEEIDLAERDKFRDIDSGDKDGKS